MVHEDMVKEQTSSPSSIFHGFVFSEMRCPFQLINPYCDSPIAICCILKDKNEFGGQRSSTVKSHFQWLRVHQLL